MNFMTSLAAAIQFLLVSPAFIRRPFTPGELGRSTGFFPLVGLLLGGLLLLTDVLLSYILSIPVRSVLVLALWILLTGALHFDGFLDSCDGLMGAGSAEGRLEIMRDEHIGAYALADGVLLLLTMFSSLSAIAAARWAALLLAPVLGRLGMTLAVVIFPYARQTGLGKAMKDHSHAAQAVAASLSSLAIVVLLAWRLNSISPVISLLSAMAVWWGTARFILHRIPGMTGDTYGAINMLIEAAVLLTFVAVE
jgi:adenosylcobinamide-GDP ribazoletransferase